MEVSAASPYLISLRERLANSNEPKNEPELSPLSGAEPKYEPNKWNDKEQVRKNHNCYAYVLNKLTPRRTGKPQPGYSSNFPALKSTDYRCAEFYRRLKKDVPSLYKTEFGTRCQAGFYKGFIAIDPKPSDQDYHFYRQDSNGRWSHKPGRSKAVDTDASGKPITNPVKADRKYKYFNYSEPCFFFCVNSAFAHTSSNEPRTNTSNATTTQQQQQRNRNNNTTKTAPI